VGLTNLPPSSADCLEIWSLNLLETSRSVTGLLYLYQSVQVRPQNLCVWYNNEQQTSCTVWYSDYIRIHTYKQVHLGAVSEIYEYLMLNFLWKCCRVIYGEFKAMA
jgi:hypothetical protein